MLFGHTDEFKVASLARCRRSALRLLRPLLPSAIFLCLLFVLVEDLLLLLFVYFLVTRVRYSLYHLLIVFELLVEGTTTRALLRFVLR